LHRIFESRAFEIWILLGPARRHRHFERIGRCGQYLRQQSIGIKRNRRDQLCELLLVEGLLLWLLLVLLILSRHRQ
jgi:hypothetical protein